MAPKKPKRLRELNRDETDNHPRSAYTQRQHRDFNDSLRALGHPIKERMSPELKAFMKDWRAGVSTEDLKSTWDYKPVQGKEAKLCKLRQIRPLGTYRVALIVVPTTTLPSVWFLNAYPRGNNKEAISLAIARAKQIWKECEDAH